VTKLQSGKAHMRKTITLQSVSDDVSTDFDDEELDMDWFGSGRVTPSLCFRLISIRHDYMRTVFR